MGLGFVFTKPVDPHHPLDPHDPPPEGWDTDIDTRDYRVALFSVPSPLFVACREWGKRELARYQEKTDGVYVFRFRTEIQHFAQKLGQCGYQSPQVKLFRSSPRAEIWTGVRLGFSTLLAFIKVTGEMGQAFTVTVFSPEPLPKPAKQYFTKALPGLTVCFEQYSLRQKTVS